MFYFIHVQGQNALTTLLHLADEWNSMHLGNKKVWNSDKSLKILMADLKTDW